MEPTDFSDAFLDTEFLKLDEGALGFIFTRERLAGALDVEKPQVQAMLRENHAEVVDLFANTTRRILNEAFYMKLFDDLSALPDELAVPFIHLALRKIEDSEVESARVKVVREFQSKRKPGHKAHGG
jgi:hypothetical protein